MRGELIMESLSSFQVFLGCALASIAGFSLWRAYNALRQRKAHRESVLGSQEAFKQSANERDGTLVAWGISKMASETTKLALGPRSIPHTVMKLFSGNSETLIRLAGLQGMVNVQGFVAFRVKAMVALSALGFLFGLALSLQFACAMSVLGMLLGFLCPMRMLRSRVERRAQEIERSLPEMLDVIALGMRSGLSFDISLKLYSNHFASSLADDVGVAYDKWSGGLVKRDEALRDVAATYDSPVFSRAVETIIRSIRFGGSVSESLEADAAEARDAYKARREESIAKAPVKMMFPTGILILPAMLLMVMGPVLLELSNGGV